MNFTKLLLLCLFLCCACDDHRLLHNLTESNASRLVGRLQQDGIQAEKLLQADGKWTLSVPEGVSGKSLNILTAERLLPDHAREKPQEAGLFASKETQRLSYEKAVAHQIEELLLGIEGILDVRVSLRIPTPPQVSLVSKTTSETSSAAVLLLSRPMAVPNTQELQELVARAAGVPISGVHIMNREVQERRENQATLSAPMAVGIQEESTRRYQEWIWAIALALILFAFWRWRQHEGVSSTHSRDRELINRLNV